MSQKVLLTSQEISIILHRLACQLIENHLDFSNTILIGLQPRGIFLAERLKNLLEKDYKIQMFSEKKFVYQSLSTNKTTTVTKVDF